MKVQGKEKTRELIVQEYRGAVEKIVNNPNLTDKDKKFQLSGLIKKIAGKAINEDNKLAINKFIQKIDLDKVAGVEILIAALFPLMGAFVINWGLGPVENRDLYNKVVEILMNPVLKTSAVGAIAGLGTTLFEKSISNKINENVENNTIKKEALEESLRGAVLEWQKIEEETELEI